MKTNEIVTVYVAFADKEGGKRSPILVVQDRNDRIVFLALPVNIKINPKRYNESIFQ
ncbi:TPA: hypothetical protein QFC75_002426 [Enterococcus faecium]